MSKIEVNQISSQCGSTLTIGQSGDTVTLACGATQTGFGRTGTVDWDTTAKTANFTAVSGNGYFVNTTSAAITVTLPASPSAGDIVAVKDYASTAATNNITIARNGSNIDGTAANATLIDNGVSVTFVYADATKGWLAINDNTASFVPKYVTATGGTITTCGDYKIHTFTSPGTFCVSCGGNASGSNKVDYLVVAGGGGGGGQYIGGGGGAGGYRESKCATVSGCWTASPLASSTSLPITAQAYPVTIGSGGTGGSAAGATDASSGSNSVFSTITSTGGGYGKQDQTNPANPGAGGTGGSGGGGNGGDGGSNTTPNNNVAGSGNTPPVSPPQGNPGGAGVGQPGGPYAGGGGGGATAAGGNASIPGYTGGPGGAGATSSINGTPTARAGGGGGNNYGGGTQGTGGTGGGGAANQNSPGVAGTTNTGGGGGGTDSRPGPNSGGNGGSGIVIIRYKYQ